jgi:hypothetical protein
MEVKAETANGPPPVKQENQNPQGPKGNFKQGGPNMQKKKNFQNRGAKMGNNQPGNNNRGPMKNEVSENFEKFLFVACCVAIFFPPSDVTS